MLRYSILSPAEFKDEEFEATPPQSLSGGQQQRMYLNREKNRQSPLVIMDEPFFSLGYSSIRGRIEKSTRLTVCCHHYFTPTE